MFASGIIAEGHISGTARAFTFGMGLLLCAWVIAKIRNRTVLIPTSTLLLSVGIGIISFAIWPQVFNRLSYILGVQYPPVLYLLVAVVTLFIIVLHLANRLSTTDLRCRRLAQELAIWQAAERYGDVPPRPLQTDEKARVQTPG